MIDEITAPAGWCAPSSITYGLADDALSLELSPPEVQLVRPGTPGWLERQAEIREERALEETLQRRVSRTIGSIAAAQDSALVSAYLAALQLDMDVLWEDPPHGHAMWRWSRSGDLAGYRFVGLSLIEREDSFLRRLQGDRPIVIRSHAEQDDTYAWYEGEWA